MVWTSIIPILQFMMTKWVSSSLRLLFKNSNSFGAKWQTTNRYNKEQYPALVSDIEFRNYNIAITKPEFDVFLFPFHPTVIKKTPTSYEVKKNCTVLAITIVEKLPNINEETRWSNRKTFTFKFMDLAKVLMVEPGKGNESIIVSNRKQSQSVNYTKQLSIKDLGNSIELVILNKKRMIEDGKIYESDVQKPFKIALAPEDFKLFHELIKGSLLQLSGWKFQLQLQRQQYFSKMSTEHVGQGLENVAVKKVYKDYSKDFKNYEN